MRLEWSSFAIEDREAIFDYIASDNPQAAIDCDERISTCVRRLLQFPESGRPGRVARTRELVITRTPYITPYRVRGDVVRVLRVLHGALLWPDSLPGA